jgi:hypothetical protein
MRYLPNVLGLIGFGLLGASAALSSVGPGVAAIIVFLLASTIDHEVNK